MKNKKRFQKTILPLGIILVLVLSTNTIALQTSNEIKSNYDDIIYVNDDNTAGPWDGSKGHPFQHITDAINSAENDDTIYIYNGEYLVTKENKIDIDKSLNLEGENNKKTVVKLDKGSDRVINISSDNIDIRNLKIMGAIYGIKGKGDYLTVANCIITDNLDAICVSKSSNVIISNNEILHNFFDGIDLIKCSDCDIKNNNIKSNTRGILIDASERVTIDENNIEKNLEDAITVISSNNIVISNNRLFKNTLGFSSSAVYLAGSSENTIYKNDILENEHDGIVLTGSSKNNVIHKNTIKDNCYVLSESNLYGIYIADGSNDNLIYENDLVDNKNIGINNNAIDFCINSWYNDELGIGNYYSDYKGIDTDNDGIGDTPYRIKGGANKDLFPSMEKNRNKAKSKASTLQFLRIINIFKEEFYFLIN